MNFHDRKTGIAAEADGVRYLPVAPHENPPPKRRNERLAALATSPLLGSRLFFPRRFDRRSSKSDDIKHRIASLTGAALISVKSRQSVSQTSST